MQEKDKKKPPTKEAFVAMLEKIAFFLELEGADPFRVRAYKEAKGALQASEADIGDIAQNKIKVKGIGKHIQELIREYLATGSLGVLEQLTQKYPVSLLELGKIPGLGVKKIKALYDALKVSTPGELRYAIEENRLLALEGFGVKTQEALLKQLSRHEERLGAVLLPAGDAIWGILQDWLQERLPDVRLFPAGELRRRCPVLAGIDCLAVASDPGLLWKALEEPSPVLSDVVKQADETIVGKGEGGVRVALASISARSFPTKYFFMTGSSSHVGEITRRLEAGGYSITPEGIRRHDEKRPLELRSEEEIYALVGLPWIPPELREGLVELDPAVLKNLPGLVSQSDIQGALHVHTRFSDGMDELEAMIAHAKSLGLAYIGISDHSKSAYYAGGLTQEKLFEQKRQIEGLRENFPEVRIFHGIESDILPDGSIDYDEDVWRQLDFIIASVHSHFQMDKAAMTERVLKAIKNPYVTILGHPTGRLLLAREPYAIDLEAVIQEIARLGKAIELNAHPQRLDVDYRWAKTLLASGVFVSINPDAHQRSGLNDIRYGVDIARKAGLPKSHILNALTACEVGEFFMRQG